MKFKSILILLILFWACRAHAQPQNLDEEAANIANHLRCPVCRGIPISESPAELAQDMMKEVREQLQQGKTEDEVLAYFEDRYGEWILLQPKPKGLNLSLWVLPGALLVGGGIVLALVQQSQPAPEMMSGGIGTIDPQEWDQLSKKIEENPKDVEALARMAHLELQKQNFERVAELSKQILAIQPKHAETFAHLGMLHFAMGEMQGAIDFFNKALKIDPKNQEATLFKGIVQSQMGKK